MAKLQRRPRREPVGREPATAARGESKTPREDERYTLKRRWGVSSLALAGDLDRARLLKDRVVPGTTREEMAIILGLPKDYLSDLEDLNRKERTA